MKTQYPNCPIKYSSLEIECQSCTPDCQWNYGGGYYYVEYPLCLPEKLEEDEVTFENWHFFLDYLSDKMSVV